MGRITLSLGILVLVAWGCAAGDGAPPATEPTTTVTTTTTVPECSAAGLFVTPVEQEGLPEAVAATRRAIIERALACDVGGLAAITDPERFSITFDYVPDPAPVWRDQEARGYPAFANIVQVLNLPFAETRTQFVADQWTTIYVWPSAFADDADEAAWKAIEGLYTADEIAQMKEFGGYLGFRIGIDADGTWRFAVEGD